MDKIIIKPKQKNMPERVISTLISISEIRQVARMIILGPKHIYAWLRDNKVKFNEILIILWYSFVRFVT